MAKGDFEVDPDERGNGAERAVPAVLTKPDRPREEYELRSAVAGRGGPPGGVPPRASLYRLGGRRTRLRRWPPSASRGRPTWRPG